MGLSLVQRSPTECGVSVIEEPHRGGLGPIGLLSHEKYNFLFKGIMLYITLFINKWQAI
jgi:hypothetical protein